MSKDKKNNSTDYSSIDVKNNMDVKKDKEEVKVEREKLDSLVSDKPKKRKKNLISRLAVGVLGPEGLPGIGSYVSEEIIVPAIKNIIVDAVTSGINMVMYGENRPQQTRTHTRQPYNRHSSAPRPTYNYTSRYTSQQPEPAEKLVPRSSRHGVEEYVIQERVDAAHVLTTLTEQADMYGSVSVADYYDLIGVPSEYTDNNYGWVMESIVRANIRPVRGGYIINLPAVEVI